MMNYWLLVLTLPLTLIAEDSREAQYARYFEAETRMLTERCLADIASRSDWESRSETYRQQLQHMLGLDPLPERSALNPVITGRLERGDIVVENLHIQSRPGLYVTGNLFRPKAVNEKLPAILYVCGHGRMVKDGVSYGNKTSYQHHGAWFARNGYVCLIIDTIQLGELQGKHHGTYKYQMWWWNTRGYTPAGVETWNGMRAIDYLQSRPEVDGERIGITGRSGGGAYSWWIAALDKRVKCAVPVAGITSLKNHVVDGCIEGHCDCMYMVNSHRWDFAQVAALVAPRPVLISNTDKDGIFPLDGVVDVYGKTRRIYRLLDAENHIGLHITEGPHRDSQELRIHAFRWMNRWLKQDDSPVTIPAEKLFTPEELKVFDTLPEDEITTKIHYSFVARDQGKDVKSAEAAEFLKRACFQGWEMNGDARHPLHLANALQIEGHTVRIMPLETFTRGMDNRYLTHLRRRHALVGQSLDGVYLSRIIQQLAGQAKRHPIQLEARGPTAIAALLATLYVPGVQRVTITDIPASLDEGPEYLNLSRYIRLDQLKAFAAARTELVITP